MQVLRFSQTLIFVTIISVVLPGCGGESEESAQNNQAEVPTAPALEESTANAEMPDASDLFESEDVEAVQDGFQLLSLEDFETFKGEEGTWTQEGTIIKCTGKPRGYIYTKKSYRNFSLRYAYRYTRPDDLNDDITYPGNTGCLLFITGEHKLWPVCLEVQGKYFETGAIKVNGTKDIKIEVTDDNEARKLALKPVGEWNHVEIISKDGAITAKLNGTLVCESQPTTLLEGPLGFQAEDFAVQFSNIRIQAGE